MFFMSTHLSNRQITNMWSRCSSRVSSFIVFTALIILGISLNTVSGQPVQKTQGAEFYLSQFGYLPPSAKNPANGGLLDVSTWTKAIEDFQNFAGLNVTGDLDDETLKLMSLPRCGVKDKVGFGSDNRSKRYALQGSRWKVKNLTYKISKYAKRLTKSDTDTEISKAFAVWTKHTDLTFTQKRSGPVHIDIRFEESEHGDGDPFDGVGGTLAHAYFPVYGGDAHFDDAEHWTINSPRGTNLYQVAAHEFGHSLGLSHSDVRSALMAPFYRGFDPVLTLDADDVLAIQALYGKKTTNGGSVPTSKPSYRPTSKPSRPVDNDLCRDSKIDAMFNTADGQTFAFKGNKYYKLTENSVAEGYPKTISEGWVGLPGNIDAAFTYKNGKTYFFKGSQYWRYNGRNMDGEYPKEISEGFTGIPDNIDAAMVWGGNGKIYFYKQAKFWRYDPLKRPPVKATYPKPISNWEGLPIDIDAALQYTNGYTYFFKGDKYYRFNDRTFSVDQADPPFPRPSAHWWFGCKNSPSTFNNTPLGNVKLEDEDASHRTTSSDIVDDFALFDAADDYAPNADKATGDNSNSGTSIKLSATVLLSTLLLVVTSKLFSS